MRRSILDVYRKTLDIGATGLSIDFCRYPEGIDTAETANVFFRELRGLADEYGQRRGRRIPILVRFPARGRATVRAVRLRHLGARGARGLPLPERASRADFTTSTLRLTSKRPEARPVPCCRRSTRCFVGASQTRALSLARTAALRARESRASTSTRAMAWSSAAPFNGDACGNCAAPNRCGASGKRTARLRPARSKGIYTSHASQLPGYHSWERLHVWLEGIPLGELELYLDDRLINSFGGPPYLLGNQDRSGDTALPKGEHSLRVRAATVRGGWSGPSRSSARDESRGRTKESPPSEGGSSSRDAAPSHPTICTAHSDAAS